MNEKDKIIKIRQRKLKRNFICVLIFNLFIVFSLMLTSITIEVCGNNKIEEGNDLMVNESDVTSDHNTIIPSANASRENEQEDEVFCRNLTEEEKYLLAKIAMAEAEGESFETKVMIIFVIINRVESNKRYFPDTVKEVIFQNKNGVYQFTPIGNGRWDRVEPNKECWNAVEYVNSSEIDCSNGALYFEACKGESWHSKNLEFICKSDNTKFYKEK